MGGDAPHEDTVEAHSGHLQCNAEASLDSRIDLESDYWVTLARHRPLGILSDLDGTLLPFATTPEAAKPTPEIKNLVQDLATLPDVLFAIVSGRPREVLDQFFPAPRAVMLFGEHGAWQSGVGPGVPAGAWESRLTIDPRAVDALAGELESLTNKYAGSFIERKTWSLTLHLRRVVAHEKMGLLVQASSVIDPWLAAHPDFEDLAGSEVLEIRPRSARKTHAVNWVKGLLGPKARLLVVGDDLTDEDMFSAASEDDASVLVGSEPGRLTGARWRLKSTDEVHGFFSWIVSLRREGLAPAPKSRPSRVQTLPDAKVGGTSFDLLVLSNRLPELRSAASQPSRHRNVGGLVSALAPALAARKGVWLGWSGRTRPDATATEPGLDVVDGLALAWVDFPEEWHRHYYNGLSNSALWPLFHSFAGRLKVSHRDWHFYEKANQAFATVAMKLVGADAPIWVHDYHLLLVGKALRQGGHHGPIGLFQHIPFPGPDIFFLLPWASVLLEAMLELDLVGFHTVGHVENFLRCMATLPGVRIEGNRVIRGERTVRAGAFPLGIIPSDFQEPDAAASEETAGLIAGIGSARMVLGVDRLDYTKGIPERIASFGSLLEQFPEWRRKASLVQVSVPSRADVPEYAEQRSRVENSVGRINGEYGEADWVPIRYLYRSYDRGQLAQLYRAADVGYVTPLRDGMNLVAKEYVAAQDPQKPGVLLLSRFAGAADELTDALITNPWDTEGTAQDLDRALKMPLEERSLRHGKLMEVISRTTALTWAEDFLGALGDARASR
jgi:alpha,alpha-trehalose-phosphate synthase [UDP-forming]/trehalose-phosphatase